MLCTEKIYKMLGWIIFIISIFFALDIANFIWNSNSTITFFNSLEVRIGEFIFATFGVIGLIVIGLLSIVSSKGFKNGWIILALGLISIIYPIITIWNSDFIITLVMLGEIPIREFYFWVLLDIQLLVISFYLLKYNK
jgi:hypothetical protein